MFRKFVVCLILIFFVFCFSFGGIFDYSVGAQGQWPVSIKLENVEKIGGQMVRVPVYIGSQDALLSSVALVFNFGNQVNKFSNPNFEINPNGPLKSWLVGPSDLSFNNQQLEVVLTENPAGPVRYKGPPALIGWLKLDSVGVSAPIGVTLNYVVTGDHPTEAGIYNPATNNFEYAQLSLIAGRITLYPTLLWRLLLSNWRKDIVYEVNFDSSFNSLDWAMYASSL